VITHFNAIVSEFRDFIGPISMRPRGWQVDFSHQCCYAQSSTISLSEVGLFCALCQSAVLQSFNVLCAQKNSSCFMKYKSCLHLMRFEGVSCFYCCCFMNSSNQVGVWRRKWIPIFVIPVFVMGFVDLHHEHRDSCP